MTGLVTRRFHGYLVAALPAPHARTMMLNNLLETISTDDGRARLSEQPDAESLGVPLAELREFRLELGMPVWSLEHQGQVIEKRIIMPHRQNSVFIICEQLSGTEILDAEPPYTPRGCCAQAWSVSEVLRLLTVIGSVLREPKAA